MLDNKNLQKPYIKVVWQDTPENFTQERISRVKSYFRKKYNTDRVNVITKVQGFQQGETQTINAENITDTEYQKKLSKEFLNEQKLKISWDKFLRLDKRVESELSNEDNFMNKKWSIKSIEFSNFLSFGEDNKIDFTKYNGITSVDSNPSNFGGKTTLTVDLLLFLFFNTTTKSQKNEDIFNRFTDKNRVLVSGVVEIDGDEYLIERGLTRSKTRKGTWSVKNRLILNKRLSNGQFQNLEGEQRRETEKFLKQSIGTMDDFLLTILTTSNNLESLIEAKPTERGQILTRFIGLEKLRDKERKCKEVYSEWSKKLISNMYNMEDLKSKISDLENTNEENKNSITESNKKIDDINNRLEAGNQYKDKLMSSLHKDVDDDLKKYNQVDIQSKISKIEKEIVVLNNELDGIDDSQTELTFDEIRYQELNTEISNCNLSIGLNSKDISNLTNNIKMLEEGEVCPTCHRKLEDVDHTQEIEDHKTNLIELQTKQSELKSQLENLEEEKTSIDEIKIKVDREEKNTLRKMKLSLDIKDKQIDLSDNHNLLNKLESQKNKLKENKEIEQKIVSTKTKIETLTSEMENLKYLVLNKKNDITNNNNKIEEYKGYIKEILKEEEVDKIFKSYLICFGKNGISKNILKNTIPFINSELSRLLSDSSEFNLVLEINEKNELDFMMVDNETGVTKRMNSGSGYEKTIASLALRAVLSKVCALPKPNIVCFDEAFGKVSNENLELVGKFFMKIKDYFERIFVISHNPLIKEWCDNTITVKKDSNISNLL